ncbi:MAG: response regulator [Bacteroidetes bacterium]|nr:response regulator [Bacteroidota bacterium]
MSWTVEKTLQDLDIGLDTAYTSVLLIDDNTIDNYISENLIKQTSFARHIYTYTNGRNALEFLGNLGRIEDHETFIPELILLDINLPILDGFQFLQEFEKLPASVKDHCRIIMLTTSVNPFDLEKALNSPNVIKYLSKPLTKTDLRELYQLAVI